MLLHQRDNQHKSLNRVEYSIMSVSNDLISNKMSHLCESNFNKTEFILFPLFLSFLLIIIQPVCLSVFLVFCLSDSISSC